MMQQGGNLGVSCQGVSGCVWRVAHHNNDTICSYRGPRECPLVLNAEGRTAL